MKSRIPISKARLRLMRSALALLLVALGAVLLTLFDIENICWRQLPDPVHKGTVSELYHIVMAVQLYESDYGAYPDSIAQVMNGGYISEEAIYKSDPTYARRVVDGTEVLPIISVRKKVLQAGRMPWIRSRNWILEAEVEADGSITKTWVREQ